jgi:hypothetical protein
MEHATGPKVLIEYTPRTTGRHTVNSHTTNESYGPRKRGDRFEVYRADMAVRPDLFRPVNEVAKPEPVVATRAEQASCSTSATCPGSGFGRGRVGQGSRSTRCKT